MNTTLPCPEGQHACAPDDLAVLADVLRVICRRRRLRREDAEDYMQSVHLRLISSDYALFRRFDGRSSLRTYLTVSLDRMLLDWRVERDGKWRPSQRARAMGARGVEFERLVYRDRLGPGEAARLLQITQGLDENAVAYLAPLLQRPPARVFVTADDVDRYVHGGFEDPLERRELRAADRARHRAVALALSRLDERERAMVRARFGSDDSLAAFSQRHQLPAKITYRRFERVMGRLRRDARAAVAAPSQSGDATSPESAPAA